MQTVHYRGFNIWIAHPALWIDKGHQIVRELIDVFANRKITLACLEHLLANGQRLTRGHYGLLDGRGCLMFVLTEPLGDDQIRNKFHLVRFFGRSRGFRGFPGYVAAEDSAEYQPAKWLVRLVDGQFCAGARLRYGRTCEFFDFDLVLDVARQVLTQRQERRLVTRGKRGAAVAVGV